MLRALIMGKIVKMQTFNMEMIGKRIIKKLYSKL